MKAAYGDMRENWKGVASGTRGGPIVHMLVTERREKGKYY